MEHENLTIEIEGEELSDVYPDMIGLDVELDDELAGMFRLKVAMAQNSDGSIPILGRTVYSCIGCGESVPSKS